MNVWKEHYLHQLAHNQQLEAQLKQLQRKVTELRSRLEESDQRQDNEVLGYEGMSDVTMRQLLRRLEKEKAEIEWQLKDCEWRLDQEAAVSSCMTSWYFFLDCVGNRGFIALIKSMTLNYIIENR